MWALILAGVRTVQNCTMTIFTEAKINPKMNPKRNQNAPPEGDEYMIWMQN
jgi:hypothetical protein